MQERSGSDRSDGQWGRWRTLNSPGSLGPCIRDNRDGERGSGAGEASDVHPAHCSPDERQHGFSRSGKNEEGHVEGNGNGQGHGQPHHHSFLQTVTGTGGGRVLNKKTHHTVILALLR